MCRVDLGAYVDGELRGADLLTVSQHIASCEDCAAELAALRSVADLVRAAVPSTMHADLAGLASTVVSRTRAESAQSWRGLFARAAEDWQWAIVGIGAVASTFVSTALLSVILAFGPAPERVDSLSALLTSLGSPSGTMFLWAAPALSGDDVVMLQFDNGGLDKSEVTASLARDLATRLREPGPSEADLVDELAAAVTRKGRVVNLDTLAVADRERTESLFRELQRLRDPRPRQGLLTPRVYEVQTLNLVTSAKVTAKGL
jgi:hypothetical protein